MKTMLLDQQTWDLCLDVKGNLAVATEPYQVAQDVASAIRLFLAELWYNTANGVPYFEEILGELPPASLIKQYLNTAALSVPNVKTSTCTLTRLTNRSLGGEVRVTSDEGQTITLAFGTLSGGGTLGVSIL